MKIDTDNTLYYHEVGDVLRTFVRQKGFLEAITAFHTMMASLCIDERAKEIGKEVRKDEKEGGQAGEVPSTPGGCSGGGGGEGERGRGVEEGRKTY